MSRETKVGLLVGLAVIVVFALILNHSMTGEQYASPASADGATRVSIDGPDRDVDDAITRAVERRIPVPSRDVDGTEPGADRVAAENGRDAAQQASQTLAAHREPAPSPDDNTGVIRVVTPRRHRPSEPRERIGDPTDSRVVAERTPRETAPRTVTVRPGDNLTRIAIRVYGPGQGHQWRRIAEANPDVEPRRLRPGMKLAVPATDTDETPIEPRRPSPERPADPVSADSVYVVAAGDVLSEISRKVYGTSRRWKMIAEANDGLDPRRLRPGMELKIPPVEEHLARTQAEGLERALDEVRELVITSNESSEPTGTYHVQANDTFYSISDDLYGNGSGWRRIYELNRDRVPDPNLLPAGTVLRLPAPTAMASAADGSRQ